MKGRLYFSTPSEKMKDAEGSVLHDITWGLEYSAGIATQLQDGKLKNVCPNKWKATPESPMVTFKGRVGIKISPWMLKKGKAAPAPEKNK